MTIHKGNIKGCAMKRNSLDLETSAASIRLRETVVVDWGTDSI